jgi:hypothetical protein
MSNWHSISIASSDNKDELSDQVVSKSPFGGIQGRPRELSSRVVVWNSVVASNSKGISLASLRLRLSGSRQ